MSDYEYTVIPAPARGEKTRAAKTPADRYALALTGALNGMAAQGWEYVRAETLPSEERSGLTGRTTVWMNVLVFRRSRAPALPEAAPVPVPALVQPAAPVVAAPAALPAEPASPAEADDPLPEVATPAR